MKLIKLMKLNIMNLFTFKHFLFIELVFLTHYLITINHYGSSNNNISDLILLTFMGPINNGIDTLNWVLLHLPYIIIIGKFVDYELRIRAIYIITRIGSLTVWLVGIILTSIIFIVYYYLMGLITSIVCASFYVGSDNNAVNILKAWGVYNQIDIQLLLSHMIYMLIFSSIVIIMINILLTIYYKNSTYSFTIVIILLLLSVSLSKSYIGIAKWLPPSNGILLVHDLNVFPFLWSHLYNVSVLVLLISLMTILCKRKVERILL